MIDEAKITCDRIEAEFLSCITMCINDWNYGAKDILLNGVCNTSLVAFLAKFKNLNIYCLKCKIGEESRVQCFSSALNLPKNQFDIIIDLDNKSTESYEILLKQSGVCVINLAHLDTNLQSAKSAIESAHFNVKMPFCVNNKYYLFLSHKFHPLADISLQKIDMISDLKYYNAKISEAAFALPNYLKDALKGIARN